jgi:hypothetical protein
MIITYDHQNMFIVPATGWQSRQENDLSIAPMDSTNSQIDQVGHLPNWENAQIDFFNFLKQ